EMISRGEMSMQRTLTIVNLFAEKYPVKISDILLDVNDTTHSIVLMRSSESYQSNRTYSRKNRNNELTPYYDYRDTATSKFSPFRPEWIKELRVVENSDPNNPDVAYNTGHFLHQMTAIVGPVNFYWEVNGRKYCEAMNTGDSNFISPFWKHSFTSRSEDEEAIIIAVTFSGSVGRARNELYTLGEKSIEQFVFDNKNKNRAIAQLIKQIINNNMLTPSSLQTRFLNHNINIDIDQILNEKTPKNKDDLKKFASFFSLPENIFNFLDDESNLEVIIKKQISKDSYLYNKKFSDYRISLLASHPEMPQVAGFDVKILSHTLKLSSVLYSSLHSFVFNYSQCSLVFEWETEGKWKTDIIGPSDSLYILPNIKHKFCNKDEKEGALFIFRAPSYVDINLQKELSTFSNTARVIETSAWFN
ncbi:hypothetical protein N8749_01835, partial [bacterium]|nr:hypothetical protein [bacterium]